ncbi:ACP S-malonyltransferase [Hahella sp. SMD15-11]|uniref:Malonyl CoA-acyl carrier protein transacylase n=1 Tax=Thermohahella caldifontis TaxID=3142973 RepID=A0AB39UZM8_9GAMM
MKTAYIFPGQGSQSVGMLSSLSGIQSRLDAAWEAASDIVGLDVARLVNEGPESQLNQTAVTQPVLLAASHALWQAAEAGGLPRPDAVAGHSLGEYSALVAADVLDFVDALKLVRLRGRLMQEAVPEGEGAMAAVLGLDDDAVADICQSVSERLGQVVAAANYNCPGQVVIAGTAQAVSEAGEALKAAGARRVLPLAVSVPSHCLLMKPAAERMAEALDAVVFRAPRIPVVQNTVAQAVTDPDELKRNLVEQLYCPVRWTQGIQWLLGQGVSQFYECGPGKVLAGLVKKIDRNAEVITLSNYAEWSQS